MVLAAVVIPRASLETTPDGDLLALAEIGAGDLRQPIPGDHGVVLGLLAAAPDELVARHGQGSQPSYLTQRTRSARTGLAVKRAGTPVP